MECKARIMVKEIVNGLSTSEKIDKIERWLSILTSILIENSSPVSLSSPNNMATQSEKKDFSDGTTIEKESDFVCTDSMKTYIHKFLSPQIYRSIISKFSLDWISVLTHKRFDALVKPLFTQGPVHTSFFALYYTVTKLDKKDYSYHVCVSILEEWVSQKRLAELLQSQSEATQTMKQTYGTLDPDAELVVSALTSFPEKMANRLQHENSDCFYPQNYVPMLALAVLDCLQWGHDILTKEQNVSFLAVSTLVGKLCCTGQADFLLDKLLPHLCQRVRTDYLWCRICERVFAGVPARAMESVVVALLMKISWYGLVEKFLGDSVVHNNAVKLLVCTKILLHKTYKEPKRLLQNIIGYLSSFHTRRPLFIEVLLKLLYVWGDKSSMRHISAEQHLYISRAVMVCIGILNDTDKKRHKNELLRLLMPGVQTHLDSSDHDVRMLGMTIAKTLTSVVDPEGPQLEFELDMNNPAIIDLLTYMNLPADPGPSEEEKEISVQQEMTDCTKDNEMGYNSKTPQLEPDDNDSNVDSDLDSDDDLEPYDMSNDKKVTNAKPPKYVRDCMEGLICSSDDPDRTEVCLQEAERLIRKNTDGLEEISVEFAKILLHLTDTHNFSDFLSHRFSALLALTVTCPAKVAEYLSGQFYERNYNIRQRLDMLEVLANAAQELSQPEYVTLKQQTKGPTITEISPLSEPSTWREVVQKRIESNTRRFAHGRTRPEPKPSLNRFAAVAGLFFYPLMVRVDKSELCLDLLGRDSLLLFRLLYTLAIVLLSAKNLPTSTHMGRSLLEFTWPLRMHSDSSVRQSVITATTAVFLVVPTYTLMSDLHSDVTETKIWLEGVIEGDPDSECQKMSAQALMILQEQVKKEAEASKS